MHQASSYPDPQKRGFLLLFSTLSVLLLFEIFRKYALPIRELLSVGELMVWVGAVFSLSAVKSRQIWTTLLFLYAIVFWYLLSALISETGFVSIILGLRPHLTFVSSIVIGCVVIGQNSRYAAMRHFYSISFFWVLFFLCLIVVQIITGPGSFASTGLFSEAELKTGYFGGAGDKLGRLLTRQTGPFTSTGKLGKVSFYLASFLICFSLFSSIGKFRSLVAIFASLALLLLSGQRAAFLFLILTLSLLLLILGFRQRRAVLRGVFWVFFSVIVLLTVSFSYNYYFIAGLLQRATSVFTDLDDRFSRNFLEPISEVASLGGLIGQGPGSFSTSSVYSGGQTLAQIIYGAENSYLTLFAEVGLIGLLLYLGFLTYWLSLCAKLVRRVRRIDADAHVFSTIVTGMLLSTLAWAMTHDAFNSTTSMYILGFFLGSSLSLSSRTSDT